MDKKWVLFLKWPFCLVLSVIFFLIISAAPPQEVIPANVGDACMKFNGYKRVGGGQVALNFYNTCGIRMNLNVCYLDVDGKYYLEKSARRVPGFGWMEIYVHSGFVPKDVTWAASFGLPAIPGNCGKKA